MMFMEVVMKYFDEKKNLVNLSNSILKHFGIAPNHETLKELDDILAKKENKKVMLFLFDGLGTYIEDLHLKEKHAIIKNRAIEITSVFPPTTVAATTALLSSKYPCETGWLGWSQYFPSIDHTVDMFSGRDSFTREVILPHPGNTYLPYESIIEQIGKLDNTYSNRINPSRVEENGAKNIKEFFKMADIEIQKGEKTFIYAYWHDPDHTLHHKGVNSYKVHRIIKKINRKLSRFVKKHPDVFIITLADHGLVDTVRCFLDDHPDLYELMINDDFLDSRASFFRIKDVKENGKKFEELFKKYYQDDFDLYTKQEVIDNHFFGLGTLHPLFTSLLGDYLAISKSDKRFDCPKKGGSRSIANHAGGLKEERMIYVSIFND